MLSGARRSVGDVTTTTAGGGLGNPAARLHAVLVALKGIGGASVAGALAQVLDVGEQEQPAELLHRIAAVRALPGQAAEQLRLVEDVNHELLLRWRDPVETALSRTYFLGGQVSEMTSLYGAEVLLGLEMTADVLRRRRPEPTIPDEGLVELVDLVRELIDAVLADPDLPPAAKQFLLERLRDVEIALLRFRVTGYAGVEAAVDALTGGAVRRDDIRGNENVGGWLSRLWDRMGAVTTRTKEVADAGNAVAALAQAFPGVGG